MRRADGFLSSVEVMAMASSTMETKGSTPMMTYMQRHGRGRTFGHPNRSECVVGGGEE
jgi:hypothetical protein